MLVDDHAVVRAGVRRLLEQDKRFVVVAEANSGESAYQQYTAVLVWIKSKVASTAQPLIGAVSKVINIHISTPVVRQKLLFILIPEYPA